MNLENGRAGAWRAVQIIVIAVLLGAAVASMWQRTLSEELRAHRGGWP